MTQPTLPASLRNQLSPVMNLITFLEGEHKHDLVWNKRFSEGALTSLKEMIVLLETRDDPEQ
jgi:hypothetical protein